MSSKPFIQLFVGDFAADTPELDTRQIGAYCLILFRLWSRGGYLDNNPTTLARIARMKRSVFLKSVWPEISQYFEEDDQGRIFNSRMVEELEELAARSERLSRAGKRGNEVKAAKKAAKIAAQAKPGGFDRRAMRDRIIGALQLDAADVANRNLLGRVDMAEVQDWHDNLGLSEEEILDAMIDAQSKRSGEPPPSTIRYFTPVMKRAAERAQSGHQEPIPPRSKQGSDKNGSPGSNNKLPLSASKRAFLDGGRGK